MASATKQVHSGNHPLMPQSFVPSIPLLSLHCSPSRLEQAISVPVSSAFTCLALIQSVSDMIPFSCMGYNPASSLLLAPSSFPLQPYWPSIPIVLISFLSGPAVFLLVSHLCRIFLQIPILIFREVSKSPLAVKKVNQENPLLLL